MNPRNWQPGRIKQTLVTPEEKAGMLEAMRAKVMPARYWAGVFKRLPATVVKFATEAGIKLR